MKNHIFMKGIKYCLGFLLLLSYEVNGQGWVKVYGENEYQGYREFFVVPRLTPTLDGNYLLNGLFEDRSVLVKVDTSGNVIWEQLQLDSSRYFDIIPLADSSFIAVGETGPSSNEDVVLSKIDWDGNVLWTKTYEITVGTHQRGVAVLETSDGGFLIAGQETVGGFVDTGILIKTDEDGNFEWFREDLCIGSGLTYFFDIAIVPDGGYVITGQRTFDSQTKTFLLKVDDDGHTLWEREFGFASFQGVCEKILITPDEEFIVTGYAQNTNNTVGLLIAKLDGQGNLLWEKTWTDFPFGQYHNDAIFTSTGDIIISGYSSWSNGTTDNEILLAKFNEQGEILWSKNIANQYYDQNGSELVELMDGTLLISGYRQASNEPGGLLLIKTSPNGEIYSNILQGRVLPDFAPADCLPDSNSNVVLSNWLVTASNGDQTFYGLTDANSNFRMDIDTGSFNVEVTPIGPYYGFCENPQSIQVDTLIDTVVVDFLAQKEVECSFLEVSFATPFLRRCFDNTYTVQYCNNGTITEENAYVEIVLDPYLTYQSSTIPLTSQNGDTLSFNLDTLDVNECGSFQITAYLDCDSTILGQTHCSDAHIFPDSLCLPFSPEWDESSITVDVECVGDSVLFIIQNIGNGNMSQPLEYIIIEDQIVLLQGDFQLNAGESMTCSVYADGLTLHMEAEQSLEHPSGATSVGATIEGCGGWMSFGFFTQYSNPDASPFVDIDCQQNVGSYDPNDKQAFPVGFGEEHIIEPQTDLEYLIRFQNTGTDTAFKVVIVDLLPVELNLATLRPGASSHPYEFSVSPEGWPMFTFNDIMLPDSNVNEAASHGFVRFKISQKEGNGYGTYIENTALIYFDFNQPIRTNTVLHQVGQIFPWTFVNVDTLLVGQPKLTIMPNPLMDSALLELENVEPGLLHFLLVTPNGQLVRDESTFGTGFEFQRGSLPSGLYFFKISKDGVYIGSGKLMVQ